MPIIYLSPSTQENNAYVTGTGSEEYWMNRLADAMIPYLNSCGIRYQRNTPDMTAGSSIRQANAGWYDFYLALHSNAAAPDNYGNVRGVIAFYYPTSTQGQRAAQIFVNNLRSIYPLPDKVVTRSTTSLGEVRDSKFPAVLLELGYHDNYEDARWIENNLTEIARNLVLSLTDFFDIPFIWPESAQPPQHQLLRDRQHPQRGRRAGLRTLRGLVRGPVRRVHGLRRRRVYHLTQRTRQSQL